MHTRRCAIGGKPPGEPRLGRSLALPRGLYQPEIGSKVSGDDDAGIDRSIEPQPVVRFGASRQITTAPARDVLFSETRVIHVRTARVLACLAAVNSALIGGFILFRFVHLPLRSVTRLFNVTAEASVPAWYNGMLLAAAGACALLRGLVLRGGGRDSGSSLHLILGAGLLFLSADEVGQLHETISGGLHKHLGAGAATSDDASHWDIVTFGLYLAVAGGLLIALRRQAMASLLRSPGRLSILAGGTLFVIGAAVVDQVQFVVPLGLGAAVEDACELFGATLMTHGFLVNLGPITLVPVTDAEVGRSRAV